jgi:UDP-glucose 4-epimerase
MFQIRFDPKNNSAILLIMSAIKALVTGGAGFIGSHLAEALCRRAVKVLVLDDLTEGCLANLAWRKNTDDLEFIQGSVLDAALLRKLLPGCDWVFHQAALVSVPRSVAQPLPSNTLNLDATLQLLSLSRELGVKRLLFASSSAIYGDSPILPKRENLPPEPLSPYALQKYAAEKYCQLFHQLYGLTTVAFRYFNVFGPRQSFNSPYSGVIARFCTAMLNRQPPVIFGDGQQTRDFTYVANVVEANLLAAEAPAEKVAGQVFNVATGQSISLLQLISELNHLTAQSLLPRFEPVRSGDVRHSAADIQRLKQALGFEGQMSWQEGLRRTLDFYRDQAHS